MSHGNVPGVQTFILSYRGNIFFCYIKKKSLEWKTKFITPEDWVNIKYTATNFVTIKNLIIEYVY